MRPLPPCQGSLHAAQECAPVPTATSWIQHVLIGETSQSRLGKTQHRWPRYQPGLEEHTGWKGRVGRTCNEVGIGANDASALIPAAFELLVDRDGRAASCTCNGHVARAHTLSTTRLLFTAFAGARSAIWAVKSVVLLLGRSDLAAPVLAGWNMAMRSWRAHRIHACSSGSGIAAVH